MDVSADVYVDDICLHFPESSSYLLIKPPGVICVMIDRIHVSSNVDPGEVIN